MSKSAHEELTLDHPEPRSGLYEFIEKNKLNLVLGVAALKIASSVLIPDQAMAESKQNPDLPPAPETTEIANGTVNTPGVNPETNDSNGAEIFYLSLIGSFIGSSVVNALRNRKDKTGL